MGWSSATELFDGAVKVAMGHAPHVPQHLNVKHNVPYIIVSSIVRDMYTQIDWDDWDTQDESEFWEHLRPIMTELGELDHWKE